MQRILEEDVLDEILYLEDLWNEQKDLETKPKEVEICMLIIKRFVFECVFSVQECAIVSYKRGI